MTSPQRVKNLETGKFSHIIFEISDASNFCRNPEPYSKVMPWCFVKGEDDEIAFDYCDIPWCEQLGMIFLDH